MNTKKKIADINTTREIADLRDAVTRERARAEINARKASEFDSAERALRRENSRAYEVELALAKHLETRDHELQKALEFASIAKATCLEIMQKNDTLETELVKLRSDYIAVSMTLRDLERAK